MTPLSAIALTALLAQQPAVTFEPYPLMDDRGPVAGAQIGRLRVPESRSKPGSREITIAFVRIPSASATPGAPVIYLDGGPGGSGVGVSRIPGFAAMFRALRASSDVILLSQRGTGLSDRIGCLGGGPMPDDAYSSLERMTTEFTARHRGCAESLRKQGADLAGYTTEESADDIEAVRRALGVPRVTLLGFSYGTHLALATVKRHADRIERVVLLGVEGPMHTWKLPAGYDAQIDAIAAHLRNDPRTRDAMPDFAAALRKLVAETTQKPITVTATIAGKPRTFTLGAAAILMLLRRDIGDTNDFPWIPAFVYDTLAGDTTMLTRLVERRMPGYESGINMMAVAMDCASAADEDRLREIRRQEPASIFGALTNFPFPDVCQAAGIAPLPAAFRAPVKSAIPALFVSGTFDSNTPPAQAETVLAGFTLGTHLIVENAGHESTLTEDVRARIEAFITGAPVTSERLPGPSITFSLPKR